MNELRPLRALIAEDHALLAEGIQQVLATDPRYETVGWVADGLHVYSACQRLVPDLLLLDLGLPGMDGLDVIRQVRRRWDHVRIVVITARNEEHIARAALDAGASAYVLKRSTRHVLIAALQAVRVGKVYLDPELDARQVGEARIRGESSTLTGRERQVLKLIATGRRNREISELLSISLKTVETHRLHLMRKLDAHNVAELVHWSQRLGLLD